MYIRFQGKMANEGSASKLGIFQLAFQLRDKHETPKHVYEALHEHLSWLKMHLKSRDILRDEGHHRAIAWFKDKAKRPLDHIWAIKALLEDAGYHIDLIKTDDPGVIIYEDGWQVITKPRKSRI